MSNKKFALGCVGIVAIVTLSCLALGIGGYLINKALDNKANAKIQVPMAQQTVPNNPANNPIKSPASDCEARAEQIGAPAEIVSAICNAQPSGNGVSGRLVAGTKVKIGSITFDAENRVWFLQNFTVPSMASYAFEYAGSEKALFDAPFVIGSELGYGKNGERVPFKICFNTEGECTPPVNLFPNN